MTLYNIAFLYMYIKYIFDTVRNVERKKQQTMKVNMSIDASVIQVSWCDLWSRVKESTKKC